MYTVYPVFEKSQLVDFYGLHYKTSCVIMHIDIQMPVTGGQLHMNYLYLTASSDEITPYRTFVDQVNARISDFLNYLRENLSVTQLPTAVILTRKDIATKQISNIPLPAYTNDFRTILCPDVTVWRDLYLQQLEHDNDPAIRNYYVTSLTENHVLQILGHEFVHHSNLFLDEAYETARWFEEGMCEYISRKWFLSDAEFQAEAHINELLVNRYEQHYGVQTPEQFTRDIYEGTLVDIFYFYWKSFLCVHSVIRQFGDIEVVFKEYQRWYRSAPDIPLSLWFQV